MIRFNELKIEDNYIIIDVQIEEDEYFKDMYIDSIVIDTQDTVYMDEVLAVGAEKDIGVELGFQLVERIRHGLGRAVVQAKERIAFVQSDVADIFHLHGNIAVAVRQKKTLAITVIALPHIFQ